MTVIIGLKAKGKVYLACDSQTSNNIRYITEHEEHYKINSYYHNPQILIAHSGSSKNINTDRILEDFFDQHKLRSEDLNLKFLINDFYKKTKEIEAEYRVTDQKKYPVFLEGVRIIAFNDRLFITDESNDGAFMEVSNFVAAGSSNAIAIGSLESTGELEPIQRLKRALMASAEHDSMVSSPFLIMSTDSKKYYKITETIDYEAISFKAKAVR